MCVFRLSSTQPYRFGAVTRFTQESTKANAPAFGNGGGEREARRKYSGRLRILWSGQNPRHSSVLITRSLKYYSPDESSATGGSTLNRYRRGGWVSYVVHQVKRMRTQFPTPRGDWLLRPRNAITTLLATGRV